MHTNNEENQTNYDQAVKELKAVLFKGLISPATFLFFNESYCNSIEIKIEKIKEARRKNKVIHLCSY